ncbi:NAD(P)/FAD-dependent oxidoreductase [Flavimaribacter sediminis]|uniref:NAD(P)/FAD-dependent oxidoreductase n=1 Tax=Flavimaribacter sediminis TaxID=2865987 RepID=UPI00351E3B51
MQDIFSEDYQEKPYWWDINPAPQIPDQQLPARTEVAIVGSGYTGVCAAIQTARGGRETLVLDADRLGWGCSSRNGGQISNTLKPSLSTLTRKYGADLALQILQEGQRSMTFIRDFIAEEQLDCDFRPKGKFRAAHNPAQYEAMAKKYANQTKGLEVEAHMVPRSEQRSEIGTDAYFGGAVLPENAALDPAKLQNELLDRAHEAGATFMSHCGVENISREGKGFRLRTAKGEVFADDVIIATSGYTGEVTPWLRRRVIPIGSYMIATEELPPDTVREMFPNDRIVTDSRNLVYYYRASPDGRRVLFGGRVCLTETDPRASAPLLRKELIALFPQISDVRVSHSWMGFVDFTFDSMPHVGKHDGMYYAMGYCGSGIATATYLGTRVGQQLLGLPEGRTPLDETRFSTRPFYTGNPWFLSQSIRYYRWKDASGR